MSLSRYIEYKNSGVSWLGEVPMHWEIKRLKYLCNVQTGDKDTVEAIDNGEYPFFVRSQTVERINSYTFDCEAVLTAGDGVGVGKVFHHVNEKFDFHQRVYMMNNFKFTSGKFFFNFLASMFHKVALEGGAKSTVDSLRMPLFMNFPIVVPPRNEQDSIVAFLEKETGKIAALIDEQEKLILLLAEKRQATIFRAVTRGLNLNVPTKNSGLEFVGAVPTHWNVTHIKRLCNVITDGAHISPETENGTFHFVSTKDIVGNEIYFDGALLTSESSYDYLVRTGCKPRIGDVLFSKDGTIGRTVVVNEEKDFVIASSLIIIRPNQQVLDSNYLNFMCKSRVVSQQVDSVVKGAGLPRLSLQNLLRVIGIFPPIQEQRDIAFFLESEISRLDALSYEAGRGITLLKERRAALISAAVTGKVDVRKAVQQVQTTIRKVA